MKVQCDGEFYILAEALASTVLEKEYTVIEKMIGTDLVGTSYDPLFPFATVDKKAYYVVADTYVTLTDGTGIVHTAPAFGEDDARVGKENDLPFVQLVNEQGNFVEAVTPWAGMFVKDADPLIVKDLKEKQLLYKTEEYEHSYPHCWRCDTPLLYYARDTWFIQMTAVRDKLLANNEKVNWLPDNIKYGRFGKFLENVIDWGLSREGTGELLYLSGNVPVVIVIRWEVSQNLKRWVIMYQTILNYTSLILIMYTFIVLNAKQV